MLRVALIVYAIGVVVGLLRVDARPLTKIVVAALWPLGALAGVVTVGALIVAAMALFPLVGAAVIVVVLGGWWLL